MTGEADARRAPGIYFAPVMFQVYTFSDLTDSTRTDCCLNKKYAKVEEKVYTLVRDATLLV